MKPTHREVLSSAALLLGSVGCMAVAETVRVIPPAYIKQREGHVVELDGEPFLPPDPFSNGHRMIAKTMPALKAGRGSQIKGRYRGDVSR